MPPLLSAPPTLPANTPSFTDPNIRYRVTSGTGKTAANVGKFAAVGLPQIFGSTLNQGLQAAPYLSQANLDNMLAFGPDLARAESETSRIGQTEQARTSSDILNTFGRDIAAGASAADREADPEYYASRSAIGSGIQSLLGGLDPNKLSGSEEANIERNANRNNIGQGTANSGSNIATVKNAMLFGDRLQAKQNQVSNILSQVSSALPAMKTNLVNFNQLTGGAGAGAGSSAGSAVGEALGLSGNLASNLMGQAGTITNTAYGIDKSKPPGWQQVIGSLPDYS